MLDQRSTKIFTILVVSLLSSHSFQAYSADAEVADSCEGPMVRPSATEVLALARQALSSSRSPMHQREIALHSLLSLRERVVVSAPPGGKSPERDVIEGEVFDLIFENFSSLCLINEMPNLGVLVPQVTGSRLSQLLNNFQRLIQDPDDSAIAATPQERYRIRLALDNLLMAVGKYQGWKELDFDKPTGPEATDWFLRYYDIREGSRGPQR
jgi:hypothetical protein